MNTRKKIICLFFVFGISIQNSFSQEIKDDTIYTSIGAEAFLAFHDKITSCIYSEQSAYAEYTNKRYDDKSVSIRKCYRASAWITIGKI